MNKKCPISESGMLEKVLSSAAQAVLLIDSGKCTLDDVLDRAPDDCRRTLEHLLTLIYRYRKSIRRSWQKFCRKMPLPAIAALLDTALTQCRFQQAVIPQSTVNVAVTLAKSLHADKFVNAVLRAALREVFVEPQRADEILPDAVLRRWRQNFSAEQVENFARLFLSKPEFTFRLCGGAPLPEGSTPIAGFAPFAFAAGKAASVIGTPEFAMGSYYIQDPAASWAVSLAADVLKKCRTLLDICCAPGGKTLQAAELLSPQAKIVAADISRSRQRLTAENFARFGVNAQIITADPAELSGVFDLVIADLPCSNSGVFRRRPDALWRFDGKSLSEVMKLQKYILGHAIRLTAPGGYLLISTCSIEADENNALLDVGALKLISSGTILPDTVHDGAFAALMQKVEC